MVARTGLFVAPLPGTTPAGTSPTDGRLVLAALFGTGGGCIFGGALTASSTAMQVAVGAAVWRIPDPTNTLGVYLSPADADTFTLSAGPASGSRIDVLYVRQNNYEAGDANSRLTYGVAVGTAAASPAAPAVPAGAIAVGTITVPTGVSNAAACTLVPAYKAPNGPLLAAVPSQRYAGMLAAPSSIALPSGTWTTVPFDTTLSDPTGLMAPLNGNAVRAPLKGRYRLWTRVAITSGDSTNVQLRSVASDGTILGFKYVGAVPSDQPFEMTDEIGLDPATQSNVHIEVFQQSGSNRGITDGGNERRAKVTLQYLGPA